MTERAIFLKKFNEAYANSDTTYILEQVSDNIVWTVVGESPIVGKEAFAEALRAMENEHPLKLAIQHVIIQDDDAVLDGTMSFTGKDGKERVYAFCDIYKFDGTENAKIREMTSYTMEI